LCALALVAELVYGTPASRRDPAGFAGAHRGKDAHAVPRGSRDCDRTSRRSMRRLTAETSIVASGLATLKRLKKLAWATEGAIPDLPRG
jgi:hypothetical protein